MTSAHSTSNWHRTFAVLGSIFLTVLSLYWAQKVLIPLALAILLSFILHPVVAGLQRIGLPRLPAVILVLCLALSLLWGLGWVLTAEAKSLATHWSEYSENIDQKISQFQGGETFLLDKFKDIGQQIIDNFLKAIIAPVFETILDAFFVIVLLVFILLKREDLRNRLIRLISRGQRTVVTTRALDEATHRISRYLFMQAVMNTLFGLTLSLVLSLVGLDYALLWGFLAALLRFIPYAGTWVAAVLPTLFSLATSQPPHEWFQPVEVLAFFAALELFTAYVLEPLLFGMSVGVSPVALLVAAIFWTWLWGPLGLLLSTPLTVCLLVLGRYVPQLNFFEVLLGADPGMEASVSFYQRLLAQDEHEAAHLIDDQVRKRSQEEVFDEVIIPTLILAKRDLEEGALTTKDKQYILQAVARLMARQAPSPPADREASLRSKVTIVGLPASDEFDELVLKIFQQLLVPDGCSVKIVSGQMLSSEVSALIEKVMPALVLVSTLPPGGIAQARYYCKRLRRKYPDLKILVSRCGPEEESKRDRLLVAGANQVATTLVETRNQLIALLQVEAYSQGTQELVKS